MPQNGPEAFPAYCRWVCRNLFPLFSGDTAAWEQFAVIRSRLLSPTNSGPGTKFAWEAPFLAHPPVGQPVSRADLCRGFGVSRNSLLGYERAGIFPTVPSPPHMYEPHQVKRLQWILFLVRELGILPTAVSAMFSDPAFSSLFEILTKSSSTDFPVHLSPPAPSNHGEKCVHCEKEAPFPGSREVRNLLHYLGNKLHVIAGRADRLKRKLPGNETADKNLSIILSQSREAVKSLEDLRRLLVTESIDTKREKKV